MFISVAKIFCFRQRLNYVLSYNCSSIKALQAEKKLNDCGTDFTEWPRVAQPTTKRSLGGSAKRCRPGLRIVEIRSAKSVALEGDLNFGILGIKIVNGDPPAAIAQQELL